MNEIKKDDHVRIVEDAFEELVGMEGTVSRLSMDKRTAFVMGPHHMGVWCSVSNLELVEETQ